MPASIASSCPLGFGTTSSTSWELGNERTVLLSRVGRSRRTTLPEQLLGAGSPPAVLLRSRGPVLMVSHTVPSGPVCGPEASSGRLASCRTGRPSLSENFSSTVLLSWGGCHSERKSDTDRAGSSRAVMITGTVACPRARGWCALLPHAAINTLATSRATAGTIRVPLFIRPLYVRWVSPITLDLRGVQPAKVPARDMESLDAVLLGEREHHRRFVRLRRR